MQYTEGASIFVGLLIDGKAKYEFEQLNPVLAEVFSSKETENLQIITWDEKKYLGKIFKGKFSLSQMEDVFRHVQSKICQLKNDQRTKDAIFILPINDLIYG